MEPSETAASLGIAEEMDALTLDELKKLSPGRFPPHTLYNPITEYDPTAKFVRSEVKAGGMTVTMYWKPIEPPPHHLENGAK